MGKQATALYSSTLYTYVDLGRLEKYLYGKVEVQLAEALAALLSAGRTALSTIEMIRSCPFIQVVCLVTLLVNLLINTSSLRECATSNQSELPMLLHL